MIRADKWIVQWLTCSEPAEQLVLIDEGGLSLIYYGVNTGWIYKHSAWNAAVPLWERARYILNEEISNEQS